MSKSLLTASLLALAVAAPSAMAHKAGDIIIRAGAIEVAPDSKSSSVKFDRGPATGTNIGGKAKVGDDTQLGLNFAYMITDQIGVELLAATPFTHSVKLRGTSVASANGKLGTLKHLPPTLSAVYYPELSFLSPSFKPYIGAGINYTWFMNGHTSSEARGNGFRNLRADDSWAWAAQIGWDYMLNDNLLINAQVRYIDLDTTAYVDHTALGRAKVDVDIRPWVYMFGLGYKF